MDYELIDYGLLDRRTGWIYEPGETVRLHSGAVVSAADLVRAGCVHSTASIEDRLRFVIGDEPLWALARDYAEAKRRYADAHAVAMWVQDIRPSDPDAEDEIDDSDDLPPPREGVSVAARSAATAEADAARRALAEIEQRVKAVEWDAHTRIVDAKT